MIVVYSDSNYIVVIMIYISDFTHPLLLRIVNVKDKLSVVCVVRSKYTLLLVNTSKSYNNISGYLAVINIGTKETMARHKLDG